MAKIKISTEKSHEIIKARFVEKKTFKVLLIVQCISLILLGISLYRLNNYHEFDGILLKITTYSTNIFNYCKGLF